MKLQEQYCIQAQFDTRRHLGYETVPDSTRIYTRRYTYIIIHNVTNSQHDTRKFAVEKLSTKHYNNNEGNF